MSRGLGDVYKRQHFSHLLNAIAGMFTGAVIRDFLHIIHYNIKVVTVMMLSHATKILRLMHMRNT